MKVLIDNANVAPAENGDEQEWTMFSLAQGASDDFVEEANDWLIDLGDEEDLERELGNKTDKSSLQNISELILMIFNDFLIDNFIEGEITSD